MSLAEVLPEVRALTRPDRAKLLEILRQDLESDLPANIEPGDDPVESPDATFDSDAWDRQIEADADSGRLDTLAEEALADLRAGRGTEL